MSVSMCVVCAQKSAGPPKKAECGANYKVETRRLHITGVVPEIYGFQRKSRVPVACRCCQATRIFKMM